MVWCGVVWCGVCVPSFGLCSFASFDKQQQTIRLKKTDTTHGKTKATHTQERKEEKKKGGKKEKRKKQQVNKIPVAVVLNAAWAVCERGPAENAKK